MKTLETITIKLEQMDSLMYSIESAMLEVDGEDINAAKRLHNLVYLLWDHLQQLAKDATEVNGHIKVCNAIFAVNHVDELKAEIERLKNGE